MKPPDTIQASQPVLRTMRGLPTFKALSNRNFRWLWASNLAAFLGTQMHSVAEGWLVLQLTGSPFYLGLVSAGTTLPLLFLSVFGGVLADRVNRRDLLQAAQVLNVAIALTLATLTLTGWVNIWLVAAIAMLRGSIIAFNMPARQTYVADLVEPSELMNAVSLNSAGMNTMRLFGPAVAGVLLSVVGTAGCFYMLAFTYMVAIVALFRLPRDSAPRRTETSGVMQDLGGGLRYVLGDAIILFLLISESITVTFGMPYQALMPVFAKDILGVGASGLGMLLAVNGLGAVAGSLVIASMGDYQSKGLLLRLSTVAMGVMLLLFASSNALLLSVAFLLGVGFSFAVRTSLIMTLLQILTPGQLRGRVMSLYMMTTWGLMPLGSLFLGSLAQVAGTPFAVSLGGGVVALGSLAVLVFVPAVRRLK